MLTEDVAKDDIRRRLCIFYNFSLSGLQSKASAGEWLVPSKTAKPSTAAFCSFLSRNGTQGRVPKRFLYGRRGCRQGRHPSPLLLYLFFLRKWLPSKALRVKVVSWQQGRQSRPWRLSASPHLESGRRHASPGQFLIIHEDVAKGDILRLCSHSSTSSRSGLPGRASTAK